jgi:malonate transporter and related proteins
MINSPIVDALFPVVILLIVGWVLKRIVLIKDTDWDDIDRIVYYVLFPSLIISQLGKVSSVDAPVLPLLVVLGTAQLFMFLVSFLCWIKPNMQAPRFTSIIQTNILANTYVAMTICEGYLGKGGVATAMATVATAAMLPIANILSIWALMIWGDPERRERSTLTPLLEIFKSPILIASGIGLSLQFFHIRLPQTLLSPLEIMGQATLPLGVLATGAGLNLGLMRENYIERFTWAGIRLFIFPLIAFISCRIFGIGDPMLLLVIIIITATPTASNSYILSRQLGGDSTFMAGMVATTTVFSLISIPLLIMIVSHFGLL